MIGNNMANLFFETMIVENKHGKIYVYLTGNFPLRSIDGKRAIFIIYDWSSNAILATPISSTSDNSIINTFTENIKYLENRGFRPQHNIMDNVASHAIKKFLEKENIKFQLVEPHNHRVNAAERAIQTFKNHFISGLCTCDKDFPLQLWSRLVKQAQDSLNLLRTSRCHPKISAFDALEGTHDFNRVPFAPPGTRATIFNPPEIRSSWGPRATDAWYIGPVWNHYRCLSFYIPKTGKERISGKYNLFPQHCKMPIENPFDTANRMAHDLTNAINAIAKRNKEIPARQIEALKKLSDIFQQAQTKDKLPLPAPATSINATSTDHLRNNPRVHTRFTRNNTPGIIPLRTTPESDDKTKNADMSPNRTSEGDNKHHKISEGAQNSEGVKTTPKNKRFTHLEFATPNITKKPKTTCVEHLERAHDALIRIIPTVTQEDPSEMINVIFSANKPQPPSQSHFCAPVTHPVTGETITKYKKLISDPILSETWKKAFGKEFGGLAQGDDLTKTSGTNSLIVMKKDDIKNIPNDRTITYGRIV